MSGNEGAECVKNVVKQVFNSIKPQLIYLKANENDNEYICMGISALDIREALGDRLEHIMLIKSEYLGDDCINNFEILSDAKHVDGCCFITALIFIERTAEKPRSIFL